MNPNNVEIIKASLPISQVGQTYPSPSVANPAVPTQRKPTSQSPATIRRSDKAELGREINDELETMQLGNNGEHCVGKSEFFFAVEKETKVQADRRTAIAKAICRGCPVIASCLDGALEKEDAGIWGGTNEADRRKILRK